MLNPKGMGSVDGSSYLNHTISLTNLVDPVGYTLFQLNLLIHIFLYAEDAVCLPLPQTKIPEGPLCIIHMIFCNIEDLHARERSQAGRSGGRGVAG